MGNEDRVETLQDEIAKADVTVQQSLRDLEKCDSVQERIALSSRLDQARLIQADKRQELERFRVRELCCYDCSPLLDDALASAKKRLVIVSPNVTAKVLNREMLNRFQELLASGVMIFITIGDASAQRTTKDQAAVQNLFDLARANTRMFIVRDPHVRHSVIGIDDTFAALAAFDWLGHTGDLHRHFARRHGVVIRDPEKVHQILSPYDLSEHTGNE